MKKLSKINLELNKEVISSLSGNEMNHAKGGTIVFPPYSYNINNCDPEPTTGIRSYNPADCAAQSINAIECLTQNQSMCMARCTNDCGPMVDTSNAICNLDTKTQCQIG